jgi:hypothetical protein
VYKTAVALVLLVVFSVTSFAAENWHDSNGDVVPVAGNYIGKVTKTLALVDGVWVTTYHVISAPSDNPTGNQGHLDIPNGDLTTDERAILESALSQNDDDNYVAIGSLHTITGAGTGGPYP